MKKYDVIIVTRSEDEEVIKITEKMLASLKECESDEYKFNVVIIETFDLNKAFIHYEAKTIVKMEEEFNYHAALNLGLSLSHNDYVIMCNSDILFHKGFVEAFQLAFDMGYLSLSPDNSLEVPVEYYDEVYTGYRVGIYIKGWCIAIKRELLKMIGKLDTSVNFWYSDHLYAHQLKSKGIKHALVLGARVDHFGSATLSKFELENQMPITFGQQESYFNARKKYEVGNDNQ